MTKQHHCAELDRPKGKPYTIQQSRDQAIRRAAILFQSIHKNAIPFVKHNHLGPFHKDSALPDVATPAKKSVVDTGASEHLAGTENLNPKEKDSKAPASKPITLNTVGGEEVVDTKTERYIPALDLEIAPMFINNCPDLLSIGRLCIDKGF